MEMVYKKTIFELLQDLISKNYFHMIFFLFNKNMNDGPSCLVSHP